MTDQEFQVVTNVLQNQERLHGALAAIEETLEAIASVVTTLKECLLIQETPAAATNGNTKKNGAATPLLTKPERAPQEGIVPTSDMVIEGLKRHATRGDGKYIIVTSAELASLCGWQSNKTSMILSDLHRSNRVGRVRHHGMGDKTQFAYYPYP